MAMRLRDIKNKFHLELRGVYEEREINSLFRFLAEEYLELSTATSLIHADEEIRNEQKDQFNDALHRLKEHVPLQYITGHTTFMDCELKVGPGVLIPRPETEEMTSMLIKDFQGHSEALRIIDVGTGSACIPIALSKHLDNVELIAIEQSEEALAYARVNAELNNADISFHQVNFLDGSGLRKLGKFNIIISNPPYVTWSEADLMRKNVLEYEPQEALFVEDRFPLVFYEQIIKFSLEHLEDGGYIYLEINEKYGRDILELFSHDTFPKVNLYKDFSAKDRFIKARKAAL